LSRGSSFGKILSLSSFGESHGLALGVVIDGVPPNLDFDESILIEWLEKRAPGHIPGTTQRKESDSPKILSGIFEGKTLGTPIAVVVENKNQRSKDYDSLKTQYRAGHADQTTMQKYGVRDHRGGGRASGRETVARVIAGYFASLIIPTVKVRAFCTKIGPFIISDDSLLDMNTNFAPYGYPDLESSDKIKEFLLNCQKEGESVGGKVVIKATNMLTGLGEPAFDKLKADLAKALLSIGAVTSFSYGLGESFAQVKGSDIAKDRQAFGGIEGGISNGDDIFLTITFKPTSTVGEKAKEGRHDPCIIPRALVVCESMVYLVLADHYLRQNSYREWLNVD
jgi:chorismate synthase